MSWVDMITMTVAALASVECVTGRIAAMHWAHHRPGVMLGYLLAAGVCILAASLIWQGLDVRWLDLAAWGIAAHLVLSWREWRRGAPESAQRRPDGYVRGVVPSRIDSGDRPM